MMNSTKKLYLIFFLTGILSVPIGLFLMEILSVPLFFLENILRDFGWSIGLLGASQFLFPFMIFSILLAAILYRFKERSFAFAIRAFALFTVVLLVTSALFFFGTQYYYGIQDASSASIYIKSGENITIYVPVLLDANRSILKMYENPTIEGDVTTSIIDAEKGKAIKINGSGISYFFSWNDVPGSDSPRLIKWIKETLSLKKPEIRKTDDRTITITEKEEIYIFKLEGKRVSLIKKYSAYMPDEKGNLISVGDSVVDEFFVREENGKLKVYTGKIQISMYEKYGRLKDEAREEFLKGFAISMSNYAPSSTPQPAVDVWVYSDSEVEQFFLTLRSGWRVLSIKQGERSLAKGWQTVRLEERLE